MKKLRTKQFVLAAIVAALYAVFTLMLAPVSYGVIQFRVSEMLKVLVLFDPFLALGIGLGTFIANMFSPFAGPWDLVWMPLTDIVGGFLAWGVFRLMRKKFPAVAMIIYAITTGASVGLMLQAFGLGGFYILSAGVIVSELIILLAGLPLMLFIVRMLKARGMSLEREG